VGRRAPAAPKLKAAGHPIGIGLSNEIDSNMALMSLMMSFGSYIQDEHARVTINSKENGSGAEVSWRRSTNAG